MPIPRVPLRRVAAAVCAALALTSCSDAAGPDEPGPVDPIAPSYAQVVYSPARGRLYALRNSGAPQSSPLSVVEIDPATGRVERTIEDVFRGHASAAAAPDAPFLYVWREGVVKRVALGRMEVDLAVTLEGGLHAESLAPLPGSPGSFAVALSRKEIGPGSIATIPVGVAVYDRAARRPARYAPEVPPLAIAALGGGRLFGYGENTVPSLLYDLSVRGDGVAEAGRWQGVIAGFSLTFWAAGPYILSSHGHVVDTRDWTLAADFPGVFYATAAVDADNERVFYLQEFDNVIRAFSLRTLRPIGEYTVPGLVRGTRSGSLVAVGSTGLALAAGDRVIVLSAADVLR